MLESMQKATGVVQGTFGVERHMLRFTGQAAHSGSTPIPMRRDAFLAAAQTALACREIGLRAFRRPAPASSARSASSTSSRRSSPRCRASARSRSISGRSMPTCSPRCCATRRRRRGSAARRRTTSRSSGRELWRIEPRPFDPQLLRLCEEAVREETGDAPQLPSGPLHDAAEMVPHMPVVMMFAYSSNGLSHCKEEDTPETASRGDDPRLPAAGRQDHRPRKFCVLSSPF